MGKEKDPRHDHRKRMRETLMKVQRDDELPDYQLLEMLLFYALPRVDTRVIAHNIMDLCNDSLADVFDAPPEKLAQIKGVSENFAAILKLVLICARRYGIKKAEKASFNNVKDIGAFLLEQYVSEDSETLSMISLNSTGSFLGFDIINRGQPDSVTVSARTIVECAIKHSAHSIILAHNHPSGIAIPSKADADTTVHIKQILAPFGIHLIDHIVLDKQDFVSMAQSSEYSHIF